MKNPFILISFIWIIFVKAPECKTTFTITDCDGHPVIGASIFIEKCDSHEKVGLITNTDGKAVFPICKTNICKTKITYIGYQPKVINNVGNNCSGETSNLGCNIQLCDKD